MEKPNWDDPKLEGFWVLVFQRLTLKERVRLEGVSRKWAALMPYADIHSVDLAHITWPKDKIIRKRYGVGMVDARLAPEDELHHIFEAILHRCGPFLHHLDASMGRLELDGVRLPLSDSLCDLLVEAAPNLVSLNLNLCVLSLGCVSALSSLAKLEELRLMHVIITEEDFSSIIRDKEAMKGALGSTINNLPALKKLNLLQMMISPDIRSASLTELQMDARGLDARALRDLVCHCPNLESLNLAEPTDHSLEPGALGGLPNLRKLTLHSRSMSSGDFASICKGCPQLEELDLDITSVAFNEFWRFANLKSLHLFAFSYSTVNDAVLHTVAKYGLLESVRLPGANLTDAGLKHLAHTCPNLRDLSVSDIRSISNEGMQAIVGNFHKLKWLDINSTPIGDGAMAAIGADGISLESLQVWRTKVTETGIRWLMDERGKRRIEGQQLHPLKICISFHCDISREDLSAVNLEISLHWKYTNLLRKLRLASQYNSSERDFQNEK